VYTFLGRTGGTKFRLHEVTLKIPATFLLLFLAVNAFAQSDRGTITGSITDPSGSLIPGVKITLTNVDTDTRWETVATSTGNYTLPLCRSAITH